MGPEIHQISIRDGVVEIAYSEDRDTSASRQAALFRTIYVDPELVVDELKAMLDSARDIIDAGLLAIRNPEDHVPGPT